MDCVVHKTGQLTKGERDGICALFGRVFKKPMTAESFDRKYAGTHCSYSYHGLMVEDGAVVGAYNMIPFKYRVFGDEQVFALSADTMIDERSRGSLSLFRKTADLVYGALAGDGVKFAFGFPNANFHMVQKKLLGWRDIGELDFYAAPLNIGALIKRLKYLDLFSRAYFGLLNSIPVISGAGNTDYGIEAVKDDGFTGYRYTPAYKSVQSPGGGFTYRVMDEDGVRAAYLIDVRPLDKSLMECAVRHICAAERGGIDVIIYVGRLPFSPFNLYKVPVRYRPRAVRMAGKPLVEGAVDERLFDIANWNVNLSNFDVR